MKNNFIIKRENNLYLSDEDLKILKKYQINYLNYHNMKELLFQIEEILNNEETEEDLEELSIKLAEYNYYFEVNK